MFAVVQGDIRLPDAETMWADVRRLKEMHEARFMPSTRRYVLVDYIPFTDELSCMIGCKPPNFCQSHTIRVIGKLIIFADSLTAYIHLRRNSRLFTSPVDAFQDNSFA